MLFGKEGRRLFVQTLTEKEAKQRFDALLDSVQSGPVTIRRGDDDIAVIVSAVEYARLRKLNIAELERLCDRIGRRAKRRGLTEEKLNQLLSEND
jgi:prevent-host-death family protein